MYNQAEVETAINCLTSNSDNMLLVLCQSDEQELQPKGQSAEARYVWCGWNTEGNLNAAERNPSNKSEWVSLQSYTRGCPFAVDSC